MIKNKVNSKVYIGQSIDIYKRWDEHKRGFTNKYKKTNNHLQKAWNKYGEENFEFSIVEKCKRSLLNKREIFWIKELGSFNKANGYNKTSGGCQRRRVSDEFKERLREVNLYIHRGEDSRMAKYSETQIRHVKMLIYCHMSYKDIGQITQVPLEYISKIKSLDKWKYTLEEINEYIHNLNLRYKPSTPVVMYDKKMNKIREFNSVKEASIYTGHKICNISSCCNFKNIKCNNYIWLKTMKI